jgi:hypothetical protein
MALSRSGVGDKARVRRSVSPAHGLVGAVGSFGGKELFQITELASLCCHEERTHEMPMSCWVHCRSSVSREVLAGASHGLSRIDHTKMEELGDLLVRIAECLTQHVDGSFGRRQFLHQHENRHFNRISSFSLYLRADAAVHRLREPRAGMCFVASPGGLGDVDGKPSGCRRQERRRVQDDRTVRALPPQPDVLHDVFGLAHASKDSVCDLEEPGSRADEN